MGAITRPASAEKSFVNVPSGAEDGEDGGGSGSDGPGATSAGPVRGGMLGLARPRLRRGLAGQASIG